jgi:hypothetical protein
MHCLNCPIPVCENCGKGELNCELSVQGAYSNMGPSLSIKMKRNESNESNEKAMKRHERHEMK